MDRFLGILTKTALALFVGVGLLPAACSRPVSLEHTFSSDEALARAVLDGIARKDGEGLLQLSVSKDEFEDLVWPTLPVSRPEVGMPLSYVWHDTFTKSRSYLAQTLDEFGGSRYELRGIEFGGPTTDRGAYTVSRQARLLVMDEQGQERRLRLFGSVIRQHGRSKIFSYIVD